MRPLLAQRAASSPSRCQRPRGAAPAIPRHHGVLTCSTFFFRSPAPQAAAVERGVAVNEKLRSEPSLRALVADARLDGLLALAVHRRVELQASTQRQQQQQQQGEQQQGEQQQQQQQQQQRRRQQGEQQQQSASRQPAAQSETVFPLQERQSSGGRLATLPSAAMPERPRSVGEMRSMPQLHNEHAARPRPSTSQSLREPGSRGAGAGAGAGRARGLQLDYLTSAYSKTARPSLIPSPCTHCTRAGIEWRR